ncbi:MAG: hypothetical protein PF904_17245, partial [Kiritimatiellae bacterium]|nr:hypothetical protein [Kiritimatiellia bacterium]
VNNASRCIEEEFDHYHRIEAGTKRLLPWILGIPCWILDIQPFILQLFIKTATSISCCGG